MIGLGRMGSGMASTLLRAGHRVKGYDVSRQAMERLSGSGNFTAASGLADALDADFVILSLPTGKEVREMVSLWGGGSVLVDTTTLGVDEVSRITSSLRNPENYLTCRLERGPKEASEGRLAMFIGGPMSTYERCRPLLDALGEHVYIGSHQQATVMKLVSNMVGTAIVDLLAQVSVVLRRVSIDRETAIRALSMGGADTVQLFRLRWQVSGEYEESFSLSLAQHVIQMALESSRSLGVDKLPIVEMNNLMMKSAILSGVGKKDVSEIAEFYQSVNQ
ncbi:2-hydroxy-3-oxopropionate reductase [Thermogymnomonas acidicola]|uniref:2-hydroxy-3-oxopropionate reductase n=1 Tax=Thermogymnomonas acidicola TaxID=399579 RepID=A0AA37F9Q0_9ARCH|nr:2-hydroxy-3-oxopropionate reductase [Thermogymnomonas acidicola]